MHAKHITPILNVSDMEQSFAWFQALGWGKCWDWGDPPTFGSVGSGECEIFMCLNGQGHRQDPPGPYTQNTGVWMSIWVDDCKAANGLLQRVTWIAQRPATRAGRPLNAPSTGS